MSKVHIVSSLTSDQAYTLFKNVDAEGKKIPKASRRVVINGGTGVANKNIITPQGVLTVVDEETLALLEQNEMFKRHEKRGFVKVVKKSPNVEKVAEDLGRDKSQPKTDKDMPNASTGEAE